MKQIYVVVAGGSAEEETVLFDRVRSAVGESLTVIRGHQIAVGYRASDYYNYDTYDAKIKSQLRQAADIEPGDLLMLDDEPKADDGTPYRWEVERDTHETRRIDALDLPQIHARMASGFSRLRDLYPNCIKAAWGFPRRYSPRANQRRALTQRRTERLFTFVDPDVVAMPNCYDKTDEGGWDALEADRDMVDRTIGAAKDAGWTRILPAVNATRGDPDEPRKPEWWTRAEYIDGVLWACSRQAIDEFCLWLNWNHFYREPGNGEEWLEMFASRLGVGAT